MASDESSNGRDEGDDPGRAQYSDNNEYDVFGGDEPRRREIESDESVYEPRSPDEDEDGNSLPSEDEIKQERLPRFSAIKPEEDEDQSVLSRIPPSSPRWSPFKRPSEDPIINARPFKRTKGDFSRHYLDLLNVDIEDASVRYVPHDEPTLRSSQIGLTVWTPLEKDMFFEALSRLGRGGIPEISRRIRSKSELEVQQYLVVLEDAVAARDQNQELDPRYPVDFPAAVEISPQCCKVLEEAADAISLRQEQYEDTCEERRWEDNWLITPFNYRHIEASRPADLPSVELFKTASWLRLSERIFMNASFPENNWEHVSDDNPSIRATALEDFYSLAVSITKRLVSATVYMSTSRIRAKQTLYPETGALVWPKDVEAAALSIGLKTNSTEFWTGCARRLRLAVFDDEADDAGEDILTYDNVEDALGGLDDAQPAEPEAEESDEPMSLSDTPSLDEFSDDGEEAVDPAGNADIDLLDEPGINEDDIRRESKELQLFTAFDLPKTTRTRQALESRIRAELRHVAHAETMDARASYREEKRLWGVLGREAPDGLVKVTQPPVPPRIAHTIDELCPARADWRRGLRYVSEWEHQLLEHGDPGEGEAGEQ